MKIGYAIVSADANPFYLDFWPIVAQFWASRLGIRPVLCHVADAGESTPHSEFGEVVRLEPVAGVPIPFQAQWARFFQAQKFRKETAIISDIDMLPMSKFYFVGQLANQNENHYVHLNPCMDAYGHLPACYHVAKGSLFKDVINTPDSWEESCRFVYQLGLGPKIRLPHLGDAGHWYLDELFTTKKIQEYPDQSIFRFLPRSGGPFDRRIDRSRWSYKLDLLCQGYYFDAHCPRPYPQNRHLIDPLLRGEALPWRFRALNSMKWRLNCIRLVRQAAFSRLKLKRPT